MHQLVGHLSVIRQKQQSFGSVVEAPHGINPRGYGCHEVHHRGTALGVESRGDISPRFVEKVILSIFGLNVDHASFDGDDVVHRIGFCSERVDDLAVHLHLTEEDQLLGATARADPCARDDLL